MFQRRKPLTLLAQMVHWIYPKGGWRRAVQYINHRIKRIPDSPHGIACGLANGMAISFTPFIGGHLIGALLFSLLLRGNYLAAALGTLIGNPLTFPLIWSLIYQTGIIILGMENSDALYLVLTGGEWIHAPLTAIKPLLWPMTVGCLPYVVLCWLGAYLPVKAVVARVKAERVVKLKKRNLHLRKSKDKRLGS